MAQTKGMRFVAANVPTALWARFKTHVASKGIMIQFAVAEAICEWLDKREGSKS